MTKEEFVQRSMFEVLDGHSTNGWCVGFVHVIVEAFLGNGNMEGWTEDELTTIKRFVQEVSDQAPDYM